MAPSGNFTERVKGLVILPRLCRGKKSRRQEDQGQQPSEAKPSCLEENSKAPIQRAQIDEDVDSNLISEGIAAPESEAESEPESDSDSEAGDNDEMLTRKEIYVLTAAAAAAAMYVFYPRSINERNTSSHSTLRKARGISNETGSDCFLNCTLQALAGLPLLRSFILAELERRDFNKDLYRNYMASSQDDPLRSKLCKSSKRGLGPAFISRHLCDFFDTLTGRNDSASETTSNEAFRRIFDDLSETPIQTGQQDAQEFAHCLIEELLDEYNYGRIARQRALQLNAHFELAEPVLTAGAKCKEILTGLRKKTYLDEGLEASLPDLEPEQFPFSFQTESFVICSQCKGSSMPTRETSYMLILSPPPNRKTTVEECLANYFCQTDLDDYCCSHCRFQRVENTITSFLQSSHPVPQEHRDRFESILAEIGRIRETELSPDPDVRVERLEKFVAAESEGKDPYDPEIWKTVLKVPQGKAIRYTRLAKFPRILAIHLNRSMFESADGASKNHADVSFPVHLRLLPATASMLAQRAAEGKKVPKPYKYTLKSAIMHQGSHEFGHFVTLRRQEYGVGSDIVVPSADIWPETAFMAPVHDQEGLYSEHGIGPKALKVLSPGANSSAPGDGDGGEEEENKKFRRKWEKSKANKWWSISDASVNTVPVSDLLESTGDVVMLFYEMD